MVRARAVHLQSDNGGGTTPALLQTTKRGYIFVLDRRTGKPLVETVERKAPGHDGTATGERYSPTQPYPIGMASVGTDPLTEQALPPMSELAGALGVNPATNDIGIVTLPDGRRYAVAVFLKAATLDAPGREKIHADVARAITRGVR